MSNLGPEKILILLAIALVILGPDKLPEAARKAGEVLGRIRNVSGGFQNEVRQAFDEPLQLFQREFNAGERQSVDLSTNGDVDPQVQAPGLAETFDSDATTDTSPDSSPSTADDQGAVAADPDAGEPAHTPTPSEPPAHLEPSDPASSSLPAWVFGGDDGRPRFH